MFMYYPAHIISQVNHLVILHVGIEFDKQGCKFSVFQLISEFPRFPEKMVKCINIFNTR